MSAEIDALDPSRVERAAIVVSNPAVSRPRGWPIGFFARRGFSRVGRLIIILYAFLPVNFVIAQQTESAPDVPDAIAVPSGVEPVLFAHAAGSQIYTCQAGADGKFSWTLKGPEAELKDRKDKVIGQHSAGPTWKLKDGSEVTGKAAAHVDSLDPDSIPWLLINVVNNSGKGALAKVTVIQRVHAHGGQPDSEACDESHKGTETKSSYTADYYFFAPAK